MGQAQLRMWITGPNKRHYSQQPRKTKVIHISSPCPPHDPDRLPVDKTPSYHLYKLLKINNLTKLLTK